MTAFHIHVKHIWFSGKPIYWCNLNNFRLTLALTVDDANYFCHCGPSYHLLRKMLSYRTCSSGHILYNASSSRPSQLDQPQLPFLGKMEQRGFTSFQSILIQPFRGCRKWKHLTNAFNLRVPTAGQEPARHDLSASDFLKKLDSQISLSKKAAAQKLKKGESGWVLNGSF